MTGLTGGVLYYFVMKSSDEVPFVSQLSNTSARVPSDNTFPNHLVISEVSAYTTSAGTEYIELYNPTTYPITISAANFKLKTVSSGNSVTSKTISNWRSGSSVTIVSKGYALFATVTSLDGVSADGTFTSGMTGNGGAMITDQNDVVIDRAGWGTTDVSNATEAVKAIDTALADAGSLERKSGTRQGRECCRADRTFQGTVRTRTTTETIL